MEQKGNSAYGYLISRIDVGSRVVTSICNVKRKLEVYPSLKPIGYGTCLSYVLEDEETRDHFYSLELDKTHISITIHSKTTPLYFLQEALLRFLSIIQIISRDYEINIASLYPYLILALAGQQINHTIQKEEPRQIENSDIVLAKRLILLMKENGKLRETQNSTLSRSRKLLQKLIAFESTNNASVEAIAKSIGLSKEEITKALADMQESGYKVIYVNSDRFNLVRI